MAQPILEDEKVFMMKFHLADAVNPDNNEEIDISYAGASPVITYRNRMVRYDIQELVGEAVELIDQALDGKIEEETTSS